MVVIAGDAPIAQSCIRLFVSNFQITVSIYNARLARDAVLPADGGAVHRWPGVIGQDDDDDDAGWVGNAMAIVTGVLLVLRAVLAQPAQPAA